MNTPLMARSLVPAALTSALALMLLAAQADSQPAAPSATDEATPDAAVEASRRPVPNQPLLRFEAVSRDQPAGDRLGPARRIAADIVAQDLPKPKLIVDVGSFTGEFLEAFMQKFPEARGQWTEPVDVNHANAIRRLGRFGKRVDYVIGCPARDISLGCVPKGVDVLITSWVSIHQPLEGIQKFYREAAAMIPSGGWLVNLDHVGYGGGVWERRLQGARVAATAEGLAEMNEGPPLHHKDWSLPTLDEHLAAFKAAGIDDVQVVWRRFNTVLIMGRKR